jgi:hypothetical protein
MAMASPFFLLLLESWISMRTGLVMEIASPLLPAAAPSGLLLPEGQQYY